MTTPNPDTASLPGRIAAEILRSSRDGPPLVSCNVIASPAPVPTQLGDTVLVLPAVDTLGPLDGGPLVPSDQDLSDLRGLQDWYLRFELTAVEGVSEVAAIGGFVKQYQAVVDPVRLLAYNRPLSTIRTAISLCTV